MKTKLFKTDMLYSGLILRITLGLTIFPHGAQKLLGWFGGYGFTGTMNYFTETVGLPWIVAFLVIILESIGALALIMGIATRLVAIGFIGLGLGITFSTHLEHGFFMNWFGTQAGEGFEFFILWIGIALTLVFTGGGIYSIDRKIVP